MADRYTLVEKLSDGTVVYTENLTGDLIYKSKSEGGKPKVTRDNGTVEITHEQDGQTISRKKTHDGQVFFIDEKGKPMARLFDQETGVASFAPAAGGNTITYKYDRNSVQERVEGGTIKGGKSGEDAQPDRAVPDKEVAFERDMSNDDIWWGSGSMCGWRYDQEDAHLNQAISLPGG